MSKDSSQINEINAKAIGFSHFWQTIASELGNSRFKINQQAESIKYFLAAESDHKEFLRILIRESYKRCHCYHLNAPFDVNIVLDILGETSFHLQGTKEDDLLDIELLEEIAWLINHYYRDFIKMPKSMLTNHDYSRESLSSSDESNSGEADNKSAPIMSISALKIRRANRKL